MKWDDWEVFYMDAETPQNMLVNDVESVKGWASSMEFNAKDLEKLSSHESSEQAKGLLSLRELTEEFRNYCKPMSFEEFSPQIEGIKKDVEAAFGARLRELKILSINDMESSAIEAHKEFYKQTEWKNLKIKVPTVALTDAYRGEIIFNDRIKMTEAEFQYAAAEELSHAMVYGLRDEWRKLADVDKAVENSNYWIFETENVVRHITDITQEALAIRALEKISEKNKDLLPFILSGKIGHSTTIEYAKGKYENKTLTAAGYFTHCYRGAAALGEIMPLKDIALFDTITAAGDFYVEAAMNVRHPSYGKRLEALKPHLKKYHDNMNYDILKSSGMEPPQIRHVFMVTDARLGR